MKEVESNHDQMKKSHLSHMVLQNLLIDHMYMFDIDYKDKTRICNTLNISMKDQRRIDATSKVKKG